MSDWEEDSGPYCIHYEDPADCEEVCVDCRTKCKDHAAGDCEEFVDGDPVALKYVDRAMRYFSHVFVEQYDHTTAVAVVVHALTDEVSKAVDTAWRELESYSEEHQKVESVSTWIAGDRKLDNVKPDGYVKLTKRESAPELFKWGKTC